MRVLLLDKAASLHSTFSPGDLCFLIQVGEKHIKKRWEKAMFEMTARLRNWQRISFTAGVTISEGIKGMTQFTLATVISRLLFSVFIY